MNDQQSNTTVNVAKKFPQGVLALLVLGAAGIAGAGPVSITQLDGQQALSVSRSENSLMYVTLPATSEDITSTGSIDSRLSVKTPNNQGVSVTLNHARNEAGTLFVYLNVNTSSNSALHRKLPLTITNNVTGRSVTLNVQVNAVAARYR